MAQEFCFEKPPQNTSALKFLKHRIWQETLANDLRNSWSSKFSDLWTTCEIEKLSVTALIAEAADNVHIRAIHDRTTTKLYHRGVSTSKHLRQSRFYRRSWRREKIKVFLHLAASKGTLKHPDVFLFCFGFLCWPNSIESGLGVLPAPSPNTKRFSRAEWDSRERQFRFNDLGTFLKTQLLECWRSNYESDH